MRICVNGIVRDATPTELAAMAEARAAWEASPEYRAGRIAALKAELAETDYKALKFIEGWLTEAEYAPIKARRQQLRNQINALEVSES